MIGDSDWSYDFMIDNERIAYSPHTTLGSESQEERIFSSTTALQHLLAGQEVWVRPSGLSGLHGSDSNAQMYSWFSGYLVSAD